MRPIIALCFMLLPCVAIAQASPQAPAQVAPSTPRVSGELTGSVLERGTRAPLPGVIVTLENESEAFEAVSDEAGRFTFYDLAPGAWTLSTELSGYLPSRGAEQVVGGEQTDVRLYAERTADNPYDVLVEGAAPKREVTRRRLEVREAAILPGSFGDPLLAVENLPGVAIVPFAGGSISMRGAATDESSTYLEGFRVPFFFHFIGIRSMIAPGMLESIDLYPGGAPANYGRQVGGVLSVNLKRSMPERLHGYVDVSLLDAGMFIEAPVCENVSVAAAGRFSYLDQVMKAADATIPRYDDYQLMLSARPSKHHQLRSIFLASDDAVKLDTDDLREGSAQITFGQIGAEVHLQHVALEHDYTPSTRLQNRARVGYMRFTYQTNFGDDLRSKASYNALMLRDALRYSPARFVTAELGLDVELGRYEIQVLDIPLRKEGEPKGYVDIEANRRSFTEGLDSYAAGAWLNLELTPTADLTIVPGVRVDRHAQVEDITLDPRVSARYAIVKQVAVKAGTGVHHGQPAGDEAIKNFGNPDLRVERALQHSAGVELAPLPFLQLDLTGFYHQLDELSARSDRVKTVDGKAVPLLYENTGEGRAYGLEVMLRQQLAYRLSGWVAYTLARTERKRLASDPFGLFDFDQTHTLALVAAYQLPRHFQLSTRFRYHTGRPTTPVTGATFVSNNDEYAPTFGATNSARLASFHQLDVRLDKQWVFDRWSFTGYLDVQNVYNRNNATDLAYSYDFRKSDKVSGLPLLAIVGIKAEY